MTIDSLAWIADCLLIAGIWITPRKQLLGFLVSLVGSSLYFVYGKMTNITALWALNFVFIILYVRAIYITKRGDN